MALSDDFNFPSTGDTDHLYAKPRGYETVRYPLSGLVGTPDTREATKKHNDKYKDQDIVEVLNQNIKQWLNGVPPESPTPETPADQFSVYQNASLNLDSPLHPFKKTDENGLEVPYTSKECVNIETQLNYTYSVGSFDGDDGAAEELGEEYDKRFSTKKLVVTGIDRALFQGSIILKAYAKVMDKEYYLGHYSVLSRRNVVKCANCLTHLEVQAYFPLSNIPADAVNRGLVDFQFNIHHRGPQLHPDLKYEFEIVD